MCKGSQQAGSCYVGLAMVYGFIILFTASVQREFKSPVVLKVTNAIHCSMGLLSLQEHCHGVAAQTIHENVQLDM